VKLFWPPDPLKQRLATVGFDTSLRQTTHGYCIYGDGRRLQQWSSLAKPRQEPGPLKRLAASPSSLKSYAGYEDDQVSEKLCLVVSLKLDGVDFIP